MAPPSEQGSPRQFRLPVLLIGPRSQGRNYDVVRRSDPFELPPAAQGVLSDFTLALAGWADYRLSAFSGFFRLSTNPELAIVVRAKFLGEGAQGTIAVAVAAVLDAAAIRAFGAQAHKLVAILPEPDAADAGSAPLIAAPAPLGSPNRGRLSGLGVVWRDRILDTGTEDPQAVLEEALAAAEPVEQLARITGWTTTASLPRVGLFSPAEAFKLIVHTSADRYAVAGLPHMPAKLDGPALTGDPVPTPPSRQIWERIKGLDADARTLAALKGLAWEPATADASAVDTAAITIVGVCLALDAAGQVALFRSLAGEITRHRNALSGDLEEGFKRALKGVLDAAQSAPDKAAYLRLIVQNNLDSFGPAWPVLQDQATDPAVLEALDQPTIQLLATAGLADGFAASASPEQIAEFDDNRAMLMLELAMDRARNTPAQRRLAGLLVGDLASRQKLPRRARLLPLIAQLLAFPQADEDLLLAQPAVADLVREAGAPLVGRLATRSISPAFARAQTADDFVKAASAALGLLAPGRRR